MKVIVWSALPIVKVRSHLGRGVVVVVAGLVGVDRAVAGCHDVQLAGDDRADARRLARVGDRQARGRRRAEIGVRVTVADAVGAVKVIVWSAFAIVNVRSTWGAAI